MVNWSLRKKLKKLLALFDLTEVASNGDEEVMSHWAKYLCVLCSGFFENAIYEIYSEFSKMSPEPVANFVASTLEGIQNPKTEKFIEVAGKFKKSWAAELESFLLEHDGERKEAINSIIGIRHLVAHAKDTGITVGVLRGYFSKALEVIEFIERQTLA